ncbi:MAG: hypothetical protein M1594_00070 [Candidatus Marsarchaeota archaeon]|nr:hypothetical protein [Candidatus Marsarchaeota archaeon]
MAFEPVERIKPEDLKKRLNEIHGKLTSKKQSYDVDKEVYVRLLRHAKGIISKGIEEKANINLDKRIRDDFLKGRINGIAKPQTGLDMLSNPLFRRKLANFIKKPKREFAEA